MFIERPPLRVQLILIKRADMVMLGRKKKNNNLIKLIRRGCPQPCSYQEPTMPENHMRLIHVFMQKHIKQLAYKLITAAFEFITGAGESL